MNNRKWFDTESRKILTFEDMLAEYQIWLVEMTNEQGYEYVRDNPKDFSLWQFIENCTTAWNGTLVEITNANEYRRV